MKNTTTAINLPAEYALVLQLIEEDGEEDLGSLSRMLSISKGRLAVIVDALRKKQLVVATQTAYGDTWLRLTAKGRKLALYIWPEIAYQHAY